MITPSQIDIHRRFANSAFQKWEKEIVATNITNLSQALAYARDDDAWHPFTRDEYQTYRNETSTEPVSAAEWRVIAGLTQGGYLHEAEDGTLSVTDRFLDVAVQFVRPE